LQSFVSAAGLGMQVAAFLCCGGRSESGGEWECERECERDGEQECGGIAKNNLLPFEGAAAGAAGRRVGGYGCGRVGAGGVVG